MFFSFHFMNRFGGNPENSNFLEICPRPVLPEIFSVGIVVPSPPGAELNKAGWRGFDVQSTCYNTLPPRDERTHLRFTIRWFFSSSVRWKNTPKPSPGAVIQLHGKLLCRLPLETGNFNPTNNQDPKPFLACVIFALEFLTLQKEGPKNLATFSGDTSPGEGGSSGSPSRQRSAWKCGFAAESSSSTLSSPTKKGKHKSNESVDTAPNTVVEVIDMTTTVPSSPSSLSSQPSSSPLLPSSSALRSGLLSVSGSIKSERFMRSNKEK